ncbi:MAG: aspartate aminotransferase family protein [Myxococcota bacterium]|jgi:acetylornithine/N-succinyldiaminopimelate aminotransferase|nr:aspartate aminotransferase family protein [Myxococcota bacterium]
MDTNEDLAGRRTAVHTPNYLPQPIAIVRGEGCHVFDAEGRRYLDMMGGIATAVLGHGHPAVRSALAEQADKLWHISNLFVSEPQVELAERLTSLCFADRAFFCNSGAEANEAALKLARRHAHDRGEERFEVVAFDGAFHGRTLFALSATGTPAYWEGFGPLVEGFHHVPFGDLAAVRDRLGANTAAIIVEPTQGEGGVRPAPPGFLEGLRELADANGCLLIFDEVQTGMGRTGPLFAHQGSGVEPDIMTLAKALGNGIPIGAMLCRESVAASLVPGTHASTFGGNPLAAACACAVLDTLVEGGVLEGAQEIAGHLERGLAELAKSLGPSRVVEVRGAGHLWAVELTFPASGVVDRCREAGVLVITAGANNLRLAPPLTVDEAQVDECLRVLEQAIAAEPREG